MQRAFGYATQGYTEVLARDGTLKKVDKIFPACTVTVYDAGTANLSTIYSDNLGVPTPKANPFTAGNDGSWFFYAADGKYDVTFSGGDIVTPWTLADILLDDATSAGLVTSVFTRVGDVVAVGGDYAFNQISGVAVVGQLPAAGGDISGTLTNAEVVALRGYPVQDHAPANGESLVWSTANNQWEPGAPAAVGDHATLSHLAFADAGHTGFASLAGSETLTNKTLTTPIIADLTNATHDHEDAAGGGKLTPADVLDAAVPATLGGTGQTTFAKGDLLVATGASALTKLPVGADTHVLVADSAATPGIKWASLAAVATHNLLSATHPDTTASTVVRGDLIVGVAGPKWDNLAVGANGKVVKTDGTDVGWGSAGLKATATLDFGNTSAQSSADLTIAVTGAVVGDPVAVAAPAAPDANTCFTAWVSAPDVVTVRFNNYSSGAVNPASGSYTVIVFK